MSFHIRTPWLPTGWSYESLYPGDRRGDIVIVTRPAGGMVTIDFNKRIWNGGRAAPHYFPEGAGQTYAGRHWKCAMVRDACAWLEKTMA